MVPSTIHTIPAHRGFIHISPVSELARPLAMSLPAVMQHLAVLEDSGLVRSEKVGRVRTCRLEPAVLGVAEQWINHRRIEWERHFDRLGEYLETLKTEEKGAGRAGWYRRSMRSITMSCQTSGSSTAMTCTWTSGRFPFP